MSYESNAKEVINAIGDATLKGILEACLLVEGQAKLLAPVKYGHLRDSISHKTKSEDGELVGEVGTHLMYGIYVEYGTGEFATNGQGRKGGWVYETPSGEVVFTMGQKPQPFLRPAFTLNKENIITIIGKMLELKIGGVT